jgi:hypothetical protein
MVADTLSGLIFMAILCRLIPNLITMDSICLWRDCILKSLVIPVTFGLLRSVFLTVIYLSAIPLMLLKQMMLSLSYSRSLFRIKFSCLLIKEVMTMRKMEIANWKTTSIFLNKPPQFISKKHRDDGVFAGKA